MAVMCNENVTKEAKIMPFYCFYSSFSYYLYFYYECLNE